MKAAVAAFKGESAPTSVESTKEQLEVERMKKELARLQEVPSYCVDGISSIFVHVPHVVGMTGTDGCP